MNPALWSVKIDNKVYDSRYEQSRDVTIWYASALRVEPSCITRERASSDCDGRKREENTAGYSVAQGREPFSLVVDHLIERLYKKVPWEQLLCLSTLWLFALLPKGLLKSIRTINRRSQLSQRCTAPGDNRNSRTIISMSQTVVVQVVGGRAAPSCRSRWSSVQ